MREAGLGRRWMSHSKKVAESRCKLLLEWINKNI
jgi:hypothetical protein